MRINVNEPLSQRQALIGLVLCVLAIIAIVAGMHYLRPYLDRKNNEMLQRREAVQAPVRQLQEEAVADCAKSPGCSEGARLEDLVDTSFQGKPVPER